MKLEIKQYLRKRKIWIALVCVLLTSGLLALELNDNIRIENKEALSREGVLLENSYQTLGSGNTFDEDGNLIETELTEFDHRMEDTLNTLQNAAVKKEWKTINACYRDLSLLRASYIIEKTRNENFNLLSRDYLNHKEEIEELIKKYKIPKYEVEEEGDNFYFEDKSIILQSFPYTQFTARYYETLINLDIDYLTHSHSDSGTIIFQFIRSLFPLIPILLAALLFFDSISEDKDSGVIKTILTQSGKRTKYLNKKILGNIITAVLLFIIPFVLFSLVLGIFDQFHTLQAPVLTNVEGITSIGTIENPASDLISGTIVTHELGLTDFVALPSNSNSPNPLFDFIPLWQFTLLCVAMAVLVIIFCVVLNMLLNVIFKNKITSVFLSIAIVVVGIAITNAENYAPIFGFLPFTYMNPVYILSGFFTYNYLNGIIVLSVSSFILYIASIIIFKRKDIA